MVAKVLVLLGTLRANSNSAAYVNAFIEGLKSKMEIDVKTINLTKKAVGGCSECFACVPHKELFCTEKDEFIEIANLNIEIKRCRNCGKFFVPDNRSDEIYCSNIFENGKTCKEIGHFKVQQKLIHENDNLRIYRNVYQKLLLRTRRNPENIQYARDFEFFKEDNNKWKENISKGLASEEEYIEWLNQQ